MTVGISDRHSGAYLAIDDIVSPTLRERRVLRQVLPEGAPQTRMVELNLRYFYV